MLKKLVLATAAVGLLMSTASAEYYIVQEKATKKCKVVETKPTDTTWIRSVRLLSRPRATPKHKLRRSASRSNYSCHAYSREESAAGSRRMAQALRTGAFC